MREVLVTLVGAIAVIGYALAASYLFEQWRGR